MFDISSPLTDAPWYLVARGPLTADRLTHLAAALRGASEGQDIPTVLDVTMVDHVVSEAGELLGDFVKRGEVSLLGPNLGRLPLPAGSETVLREAELEAKEALLALVRYRRHQGIADCREITAMLARLRLAC